LSENPRHRILVVEDDPEIQYLLTIILDAADREVVAVASGGDAQAVLDEGGIDLVVLDLILPDMDGRTLLTRLRKHPETTTTPVVVISARGGAEIRQDSYALGADHFAEKPFDPDEVAEDIAARLERLPGKDVAHLDPRTGLLSRAGLLKRYSERSEESALALVELDGFLPITEEWGWEVGAEVLQAVADAIEASAGDDAGVGRLGGGEFIVFEPGGSLDSLTIRSEKVLQAIRGLPMDDPEGETFRLTASIGVVAVSTTTPLEDALDEARQRLFRARASGRNQVVSRDDAVESSGARVLVAEDDEISATILIHRLEKEGLDVVRYDNGRAAYEGALEETPDLVILDVKMPGMDGFEVLERLRRTPAYWDIPIILLTSMGSEADIVRGFQLGADDYVLKPFSPIELSARVWRLLRRGRSATAV
jgi:diguanylate cyclase (GGDEF)-like protein